MDGDADDLDATPVADLDRRLLQLLKAGHSTVGAGELVGLTPARTALRLQALRERLGVSTTAEAVDLVCGGDPRSDPRPPPAP